MTPSDDSRPLAGVTVLVTRARAQAARLVSALEGYGATVLAMPVIRLVDPEDWEPVDTAIERLDTYDWVVFSSANAVERFMRRVESKGATFPQVADGPDDAGESRQRIAAVGPATARRCRANGIEPDYIPDEAIAEGLIRGFEQLGVGEGDRVLIPRALKAREVLPEALRARGVNVDVVPVYRTLNAEPDPDIVDRITAGDVQCVTFTSPSTVRGFFSALPDTGATGPAADLWFASIGPVTTAELEKRGLTERVIEAAEHTAEGLAAALADALPEARSRG
ncbi:MAG: uroporphyrinogen-III synthase [Coriobacteriia bacterium]